MRSMLLRRRMRGWLLALGVGLTGGGLVGCTGRAPFPHSEEFKSAHSSGPHLVVFNLSRAVPEAVVSSGFLPRAPQRTFTGLVRLAQDVLEDTDTAGVFLRFGGHQVNWAQAQGLGRAFAKGKAAGKPIYCHADMLSNTTLWLALSACEKIWLSPAGGVDAVGIAGQAVYLKGLLERLKVKADFLHMGRYKSAAETFTMDGPSEAAQESTLAVLRSIRDSWHQGVEDARSLKDLVNALEEGPWDPQTAQKLGLVDNVGYESDARAELKARTSVDNTVSASGSQEGREAADELASIFRMIVGVEDSVHEPHIAVLPAQGGIAMSEGSGLGDGGIFANRLRKTIRRLKDDESVKAVVLRIDSPGGSALASDLLWHELVELKKEKPVIASVGSMAASGGYYMACAADQIIAEETSIVGSIGVVGGKFVVNEALAEYGVKTHTFVASDAPDAGTRATYNSLFSPWDDATREQVRRHMESVYELFLDRVSKGRNRSVEEIRKIAEGRIWSGTHGKQNGLVDELGGVSLALKIAKDKSGLPEDAPVVLEGGPDSLLEFFGIDADAEEDGDAHSGVASILSQAKGPGVFKAMSTQQQAFLQSYAPLFGEERVVAALPFLLETR